MSTFSDPTTTSGHQLVSQTGQNLVHVPSSSHLPSSLYPTTNELGALHSTHLSSSSSLLTASCLQTIPDDNNSSVGRVTSVEPVSGSLQLPGNHICCTSRYNKRQWDSRESDKEEDNCEVDVVSSLESLSLSESHRSDFNPQISSATPSLPSYSVYCPRTCRQEALWEDITVDDLAGYMDQLLYLPRPMSDSAELMYA